MMLLPVYNWIQRRAPARSLVSTTPFIPSTEFPWNASLEAKWGQIREEVDVLLDDIERIPRYQDIADTGELSTDDRWKLYVLRDYGFTVPQNMSKCPRTVGALHEVPGLVSAFFSILGPGKHVPAHTGAYRGLIKCHLALRIPGEADQCRIRVDESIECWTEGETLFFDDTYQHEVWNDTEELRVVLILDVERPMYPPFSWVNRLMIWGIGRSEFARKQRLALREWSVKADSDFNQGQSHH